MLSTSNFCCSTTHTMSVGEAQEAIGGEEYDACSVELLPAFTDCAASVTAGGRQ